MHDLPLEFKRFIKTKNLWRYAFQVVWARRPSWIMPVLMINAVVFGIAFGLLATKLSLQIGLFALGAIVILFVALYRPEFVILLLLMMSSTFIDRRSLPYYFGFSMIDFCVIFLVGLVVIRLLSNKDHLVRTPLDWPILLFFAASTLSNINGIYNLGTINNFRDLVWRITMNYMIFFAVTHLIRTRRQLMTLVGGMFVMATIVAAFMVIQQAIGTSVSILPDDTDEVVNEATTLGQAQAGVARVSTTADAIVFILLLPAFILHATPEYLKNRKWLSLIPVILFPAAIAFTFDRNLWIGGGAGGILFVLVSRIQSARFILLILTLIIGLVLLIPIANAYFPRVDSVIEALFARFNSLFTGDELVYDSSTQWRLTENELAISKFLEYPVLGMGPGAKYRPVLNKPNTMQFIHNGYLWLLVDFGLVGFLPFLWFSIAHLARGILSWYTLKDHILRGIVIGFAMSYVGLLVSNLAAPRFITIHGAILVGVMLGINQVAIRLRRPADKSNNI